MNTFPLKWIVISSDVSPSARIRSLQLDSKHGLWGIVTFKSLTSRPHARVCGVSALCPIFAWKAIQRIRVDVAIAHQIRDRDTLLSGGDAQVWNVPAMWSRPRQYPEKKWRKVKVRVEWRVTHASFNQENTVCVLFQTKHHQSFPKSYRDFCVPKLPKRAQTSPVSCVTKAAETLKSWRVARRCQMTNIGM